MKTLIKPKSNQLQAFTKELKKLIPSISNVIFDDVLVQGVALRGKPTISLANGMNRGEHIADSNEYSLSFPVIGTKQATIRGFAYAVDFTQEAIDDYKTQYPVGRNLKDKVFWVETENEEGEIEHFAQPLALVQDIIKAL